MAVVIIVKFCANFHTYFFIVSRNYYCDKHGTKKVEYMFMQSILFCAIYIAMCQRVIFSTKHIEEDVIAPDFVNKISPQKQI